MWDADVYAKFRKERMQPSIDLLNRVIIGECNRIIDIGCGSGMSTIQLRKRFREAEIIGVDLSESMLRQAKDSVEDVKWIRRDCSKKLNDLGTFDLVFSNAFLQWINNQDEFIMNTKDLLNDDGIFAIQIPAFEGMIISNIIKDTANEFDGNNKVFCSINQSNCFNYYINEYYDIFSRYYSDIELWQTNYIHQMKDHASIIEFVKGTALIPYLERLDAKQADEFMKILHKKIKQCYAESENGTVLFEFKRIFIIAKK